MRWWFGISAVSAIFVVGGCATVETPSVIARVTRPEIGVLTPREVGAPLFEMIVAKTSDGIQFAPGTQIRTAPAVVVEPSAPFVATGTMFCGPADQTADLVGPISHHSLRYGACTTEGQLRQQNIGYRRGPVTSADPANFQQQLLYEGKVGKELRLSYREFRGDFARPAFNQELRFDLADGHIVGAKGARIEVVSATNTEIVYRVLQPFVP